MSASSISLSLGESGRLPVAPPFPKSFRFVLDNITPYLGLLLTSSFILATKSHSSGNLKQAECYASEQKQDDCYPDHVLMDTVASYDNGLRILVLRLLP